MEHGHDGPPGPPPGAVHPLEKAAELLGQVHEQIANFLVHQPSEGSPDGETLRSLDKKVAALAEKLDRLETRLSLPQTPASSAAPGAATSSPEEIRSVLDQQNAALARVLSQVQDQVQSEFQEMARLLCSLSEKLDTLSAPASPPEPAPEPEPETPAISSAQWEQAILGPDLAAAPALALYRQQLIDGILAGDPGACSLAGQLLVFHSAPAERLPQLLKDLGEAYYRWQPKTRPGTAPLEGALVEWLRRCCDSAGLANTIELVHPGERFDSSRHNAMGRGVEITEVLGWIVLRDNGKVYMKATVSVR